MIRDRTHLGIKLNGYRIDMLRIADSIAITVENEKESKKYFRNNQTGDGKQLKYENKC